MRTDAERRDMKLGEGVVGLDAFLDSRFPTLINGDKDRGMGD